jgi:hypothetical protein
MNSDPFLFLDFDGVLHPDDAAYLDNDSKPEGLLLFRWAPVLMEILSKFPDVKVVISSSWRFMWEYEELLSFIPEDLRSRIVGITNPNLNRYPAIADYVEKHEIKNYVILDDMPLEFPRVCKELIICKPTKGVNNPLVIKKLEERFGEFSNKNPS